MSIEIPNEAWARWCRWLGVSAGDSALALEVFETALCSLIQGIANEGEGDGGEREQE